MAAWLVCQRWGLFSGGNRLALVMTCIIYWQAKEIGQAILEGKPETAGADLSLAEWKSYCLISAGRENGGILLAKSSESDSNKNWL